MVISIRLKNFFSLGDEVMLDFTAEKDRKNQKDYGSQNLIDFNGDKFVNIIGLFGGNAAGKSNIIKAIDFCRNLVLYSHLNNEGTHFDFQPFKFREESPSEFSINFVTEGIEYEYSFQVLKDKVLSESLFYYPNKRRAHVFTRSNTTDYVFRKGSISRPAEVEANTGSQTLFISRASSMNRAIPQTVFRFFLNGIRIGTGDFDLSKTQIQAIELNKEMLLKALEVGDSDIVDFRINEYVPGHFSIQTFHKENPSLPFNFDKEESDGTKRLFFILLMLIQTASADTTIFFDEFDLKLHFRLAEFLLDAVRASGKSQLVFTSHNPALINRNSMRDEQIVFVTKLPDGQSEFVPLSDFEGANKIKDIQTAYLQGRFDGVPYLGNIQYIIKDLNKQ